MLCNKTEATGSPKLAKSEKSLLIMRRKNMGKKIYFRKTRNKKKRKTKKSQTGCVRKAKSGDNQKLPKPSTTHPPGTSTAPPSGSSVNHRPSASLGDSKPASMANVCQPPIEKPQKIHCNQTSSFACKIQNLQNSE